MGSVTIKLDFRELDRRADRALQQTARAVGIKATAVMGARLWSWPNTTKRRNGELAGKTRNVVDRGVLRDALREPQQVQALQWRLTWDTEYAAAVFLGAVFRKRSLSLPARNVPLAAVRALNLSKVYAQAWAQ